MGSFCRNTGSQIREKELFPKKSIVLDEVCHRAITRKLQRAIVCQGEMKWGLDDHGLKEISNRVPPLTHPRQRFLLSTSDDLSLCQQTPGANLLANVCKASKECYIGSSGLESGHFCGHDGARKIVNYMILQIL